MTEPVKSGQASVPETAAEATKRLGTALASLESAINTRFDQETELIDAEAEIQRMGTDRSRLAESLDKAEARSQQLEATNREVSRRLIDAMEVIRSIIDREE